MPILFYLQTLFSIWMLVDAIRRDADRYWWFIVMVPFGEVAYFVAVVLPDLRRSRALTRWFTRAPTVAELEQAFEESPSYHNRLRLAQGLFDAGQFAQAGVHFEAALDSAPTDRAALYGFAHCALQVSQDAAAIEALETLVDLDPNYLDSVPAMQLADLYWEAERHDRALEVAERLCRGSQRIGARVLLGGYLVEQSRADEARALLEKGLATYATSPAYIRRRDRQEAQAAKALLRAL